MSQPESFLHTTHRTVAWFKKAFAADELELAAQFQRHAVWTIAQKSYLIDTILNGLPIPELYMQDLGSDDGEETHIVVDGQQRIRAVLDFLEGVFRLEGDDVSRNWRNRYFEDLTPEEKKTFYNYKFVVRILPSVLPEEEIRLIFARINKNTVALNDQEIRNATYWGPFIKSIQQIADDDPFWADSGVFSANDHRRMLDHEFISELAIAHLHGPQNKKDKLDQYYIQYETEFERRDELVSTFRAVANEIPRILPDIAKTRWKKKSDFYTFFLELAGRVDRIPFAADDIARVRARMSELAAHVEALLRIEESNWQGTDPNVVAYARNVSRAASDRGNRVARAAAFARFVFNEEPVQRLPERRAETETQP